MGLIAIHGAKVIDTVIPVIVGLDQETYYHSVRVQKLAVALGRRLGLHSQELETLSLGALLHDVGKQKIPDHILHKPERLTDQEWEVMEGHAALGWKMVSQLALDRNTSEIVLHHHLWYNGQGGYPRANSGSFPSPLAQITTVADVIDAMSEDRAYRQGLSLQASLDFLLERSGRQFSPEVVNCAIHTLAPEPVVASF